MKTRTLSFGIYYFPSIKWNFYFQKLLVLVILDNNEMERWKSFLINLNKKAKISNSTKYFVWLLALCFRPVDHYMEVWYITLHLTKAHRSPALNTINITFKTSNHWTRQWIKTNVFKSIKLIVSTLDRGTLWQRQKQKKFRCGGIQWPW